MVSNHVEWYLLLSIVSTAVESLLPDEKRHSQTLTYADPRNISITVDRVLQRIQCTSTDGDDDDASLMTMRFKASEGDACVCASACRNFLFLQDAMQCNATATMTATPTDAHRQMHQM
nr:uncharacterized protein SPBC1685.12c [Schizosaccharomyces pombe]O74332.1 RecName: Full=Putative uncharacterized protein SPBC1685.12c; Flags: Precursor [Schizosaccharomyces pombe 972h-]CAA20060.1 dubious [Schizosaccharomyces pombe]|eukprot:NP_001342738.1 uncharacterized protein SPBC1685.12c [Schizosaccharomyces pombe]